MKITKKWLEEKKACSEGKNWFVDQGITEPIAGLKNLISHDKLDWANWLIVRVMTRKQYLAYSIFAAEQVIEIYEKRSPGDDRPRKAIAAAKVVLEHDTKANRALAHAAYAAAYAAYAAAYAAYAAAYAAVYAAVYAAAYVADNAAYAACAVAYDYACAAADNAAKKEMKIRILNYGISLLEDK